MNISVSRCTVVLLALSLALAENCGSFNNKCQECVQRNCAYCVSRAPSGAFLEKNGGFVGECVDVGTSFSSGCGLLVPDHYHGLTCFDLRAAAGHSKYLDHIQTIRNTHAHRSGKKGEVLAEPLLRHGQGYNPRRIVVALVGSAIAIVALLAVCCCYCCCCGSRCGSCFGHSKSVVSLVAERPK
eukprot:Polyplicarium_translucidae@DN1310_c0_g1_i1.p1